MKDDWRNKRVTVMGLGLHTGGVETVQYFVRRGAKVLVTDLHTGKDLAESVAKVKGPNVAFRLGGHDRRDFVETDLVVANPGVHPANPFLRAARRAGVPVDAEMNIVFRARRAPIVGITGSNGKSTTAALIAHLLKASGKRVRLGGNIGRSLLNEAHRFTPRQIVVLEISSFQLEYLGREGLSPHVAVVMNVQKNHLNYHKTMANYARAKRQIVEHQTPRDFAVLNADDWRVRRMAEHTRAKVLWFSVKRAGEAGGVARRGLRAVRNRPPRGRGPRARPHEAHRAPQPSERLRGDRGGARRGGEARRRSRRRWRRSSRCGTVSKWSRAGAASRSSTTPSRRTPTRCASALDCFGGEDSSAILM